MSAHRTKRARNKTNDTQSDGTSGTSLLTSRDELSESERNSKFLTLFSESERDVLKNQWLIYRNKMRGNPDYPQTFLKPGEDDEKIERLFNDFYVNLEDDLCNNYKNDDFRNFDMKVSNYRTILDEEALNSYGSSFFNRLGSALSRRGGKHKQSKKRRKHKKHNKSRKH
jgi:hypothetical protein